MSLRLEMLQIARVAPTLLRESAELVHRFILAQQDSSGGFFDRKREPDLYYSVFALESLLALRVEAPRERVLPFLARFGDGAELDFVHRTCLARAYASLGVDLEPAIRDRLVESVRACRAADGGFASTPGSAQGSVYGAFLAVGALQDLGLAVDRPEELAASLRSLETDDGGFANESAIPLGATPATAAAITIFRQLGEPIPPRAIDWLAARARPEGGFFAVPRAPMPDLLSTATALHALACAEYPLSDLAEPALDFVDTLWTAEGSFHGSWADDTIDCEYTWYGLLALGHLAAVVR